MTSNPKQPNSALWKQKFDQWNNYMNTIVRKWKEQNILESISITQTRHNTQTIFHFFEPERYDSSAIYN